MQKRRLTLLATLALSVLLHFVLVAGSELAVPDFYSPPDEVLERKKPTHVQRVQLMAGSAEKSSTVAPGIRYLKASPSTPTPPPKKKKHKQKAAKEKPVQVAEEPAPAVSTPETRPTESPSEENVEAGTAMEKQGAPIPPAPEPAPAFPVQLKADLELRFNGLSAKATQTWVMEGHRYAISVKGSKFGFRAQLDSEGEVGSDGGLRPAYYAMRLNDRVRNFTQYQNGMVRYGKPGSPRDGPLPFAPQDTASLPFHVAVTFNGQPQTFFVSTGNNVYQVRLSADAEETIKLPAGTLRTLHLRGERFDPALGKMITGYEVWLALDYLNFPVKFIGLTGKGDRVEYRVLALELEGKRVLGGKSDEELTPDDGAIPDWMQQHLAPENLNNP